MRKIRIEEYIDKIKRNHAECEKPKVLEQWCKENNIKYFLDECSLDWYQIKLHVKTRHIEEHKAPTYDHERLFADIDGNRIITHQPYRESNKYKNKLEIENWCEERGLSVEISEPHSWYYQGETILYVYRLADEDRLKTYIQKYRCL